METPPMTGRDNGAAVPHALSRPLRAPQYFRAAQGPRDATVRDWCNAIGPAAIDLRETFFHEDFM
jgi:hypothetical protein